MTLATVVERGYGVEILVLALLSSCSLFRVCSWVERFTLCCSCEWKPYGGQRDTHQYVPMPLMKLLRLALWGTSGVTSAMEQSVTPNIQMMKCTMDGLEYPHLEGTWSLKKGQMQRWEIPGIFYLFPAFYFKRPEKPLKKP